MTRSTRTLIYYALVAFALTVAMAGGLLAIFRPALHTYVILAAWLIAINFVALGYYSYDKARARSAGSRIPEVVLHGLAALGGTPGAYLGMVLFRHKTVKPGFRILFWLIVVLQFLLLVALLVRILEAGDWYSPAATGRMPLFLFLRS